MIQKESLRGLSQRLSHVSRTRDRATVAEPLFAGVKSCILNRMPTLQPGPLLMKQWGLPLGHKPNGTKAGVLGP